MYNHVLCQCLYCSFSFLFKPDITLFNLVPFSLPLRKGCNEVSPGPALLQAEHPHFSQPFFTGEKQQQQQQNLIIFVALLWTHSDNSMSI